MPKKSIREEMLARRKCLAAASSLSLSLRVQERLLTTPQFADAGTLALYSATQNEVFTEAVFAAARRSGKKVAYPRVSGKGLEFVEVADRCELGRGAFGILEPSGSRVVPLGELDLLVVPGVAFDLTGHRLGYGKGYYDRLLHDCGKRGVLAGFCFEFQLVEALPAESHDVRMDLVITEERVLGFCGLTSQRLG